MHFSHRYIAIGLFILAIASSFVEAERKGGKAKIILSPTKSRKNRSVIGQEGKKVYNVVLRDDKANKLRKRGSGDQKNKINLDARKSLKDTLKKHLSGLKDNLESEMVVVNGVGEAPKVEEPVIESSAVIGDSYAGYTTVMDDNTVEALANSDDVDFIEEDFPIIASGYQAWSPWGLTRINQAEKNSDTFAPYSTGYSYSETGKGVTAYILDSGMNKDHTEFSGNRIKNMVSFVKDQESNPIDDLGHGTMVASAFGGKRLGVAKDVTFKSVKVIAKKGGTASNIVSGLNWIVDDWKNSTFAPSIVNMSVGSLKSISKTIDTAVKSAESAGLLIVIAAGNIAIDACTTSPSSSGVGLVVGAISHINDELADFSNNGPCVQVLAPGENILLASYTDNNKVEPDKGTSFASPIVAGVAALYLEKNPKATPSEIKKYIISKAIPSGKKLEENTTGLIVNYAPA
ncbi:hypothetical protein BB561_006069 [Smittium simulii]|uniref:Peptidase S8/S53 domain-containing protein n=1 Tax=Smittium simulii TaxID=133385 RepID=A0A2T9Y6M3_9FUNG|nr:hypothetical protein BB561_006069 [Smittium simulii]